MSARMRIMMAACLAVTGTAGVLEDARQWRDRQDRPALEAAASRVRAAAEKEAASAPRQYEAAAVYSYLAELLAELQDPAAARQAAEAGLTAAERAVALESGSAEYQRVLGVLCGQVIPPRNVPLALQYGRRSLTALDRALQLDSQSPAVYLSRGIGKYYLPAMFGGGPEAAMQELRKALEFDPRSDEAHLWLGLALRKANRHAEARRSMQRAVELNPERKWAKQQLDKTPAQ
jgi:tetratricopeptide (TPR) repeat protein